MTLSKWFSTICPQTIFARLLLQMAFNESHLLRAGFPHSDICGSMLVCQLPAAFRRLPRPSSPVIAKASTTCTLVLDPITLRPRSRPQGSSAKGLLQRLCCSHHHRTLNGNERYIQSKPSHTTSTSMVWLTSSKLLKNKPPLALKKPEPSKCPFAWF